MCTDDDEDTKDYSSERGHKLIGRVERHFGRADEQEAPS
jgi:hypothetical protein